MPFTLKWPMDGGKGRAKGIRPAIFRQNERYGRSGGLNQKFGQAGHD